MASARIAADDVYRAAVAKRSQSQQSQNRAKADWFKEELNSPVKRGAIWWRRDHYRTQAELEAVYVKSPDYGWGSHRYWAERCHEDEQARATKFAAIAKAALTKGVMHSGIGSGYGDGFVTLDADEVRFLGLEASQ